jgi:hypothetical protein
MYTQGHRPNIISFLAINPLYIILTLKHDIKGATCGHKRCMCNYQKGSNNRCLAPLHREAADIFITNLYVNHTTTSTKYMTNNSH